MDFYERESAKAAASMNGVAQMRRNGLRAIDARLQKKKHPGGDGVLAAPAPPRCPDHGARMIAVDESFLRRHGCRRGHITKRVHRRWWRCSVPGCFKVRAMEGFIVDPRDMKRDRLLGAPITDAGLRTWGGL